ncbi:hypothetical protein [Flaviaesturariibacter amylovorans]|uniref:Uncharacterized protein n=1 Tax=Flaviaesturariibacter amylovorans TaxID=1084520 RepID=A0ABP8GPD1_9BACT
MENKTAIQRQLAAIVAPYENNPMPPDDQELLESCALQGILSLFRQGKAEEVVDFILASYPNPGPVEIPSDLSFLAINATVNAWRDTARKG